MDASTPFTLVLAALPALAVVIKTLWPGESRGLAHRLTRTLEVVGRMPDGEGKAALQAAAHKMASQLAWSEDRRMRRRVDGGSVFAVIVVVVLGGGLAGLLWQVDNIFTRVAAVLIALFAVLLVVVGGLPQVRPVRDTYRFEEQPTPPRRRRTEK